ncbi:Lachesin [Caligus rogercresseyi]|uniref:Lachesin n=1 Tax=Caligus rogercresseyi TaxID=217165 RepID=A0A7T8K8G3_CALRO|nr:Lachesin [Caligus rogercresseyi]
MRYDTASSNLHASDQGRQINDEAVYQCEVVIGNTNKVTRHVALSVSKPPP